MEDENANRRNLLIAAGILLIVGSLLALGVAAVIGLGLMPTG